MNFWVASLFSPLRLLLLYPNWPSHCPVGEMSETLHNLSLRYIRTPDPFHVCLCFSSINHEPVLVRTWSCVPSPGPALLPADPWMELLMLGVPSLSYCYTFTWLFIVQGGSISFFELLVLWSLPWRSWAPPTSVTSPDMELISWRWRFSYS